MKKIILLTILLTSVFLYGCGNATPASRQIQNQPTFNNNQPTTPPVAPEVKTPTTKPEITTPPAVPTAPAESAKQSVTIQGFAFNPSALTVSVGTTVSWTNEDSAPHGIKSANFNSSILGQGQTFEYKFETAGTYDYSCSIHPYMTGQIIVK